MQIYVDHVFISDRRRAVIGPICRYSDQLPISIRYGHADWVTLSGKNEVCVWGGGGS